MRSSTTRHVVSTTAFSTEVEHLLGDAAKAREKLGWRPRVSFAELVRMMVEHDLDLARREKLLPDSGFGPANGWTSFVREAAAGRSGDG